MARHRCFRCKDSIAPDAVWYARVEGRLVEICAACWSRGQAPRANESRTKNHRRRQDVDKLETPQTSVYGARR